MSSQCSRIWTEVGGRSPLPPGSHAYRASQNDQEQGCPHSDVEAHSCDECKSDIPIGRIVHVPVLSLECISSWTISEWVGMIRGIDSTEGNRDDPL